MIRTLLTALRPSTEYALGALGSASGGTNARLELNSRGAHAIGQVVDAREVEGEVGRAAVRAVGVEGVGWGRVVEALARVVLPGVAMGGGAGGQCVNTLGIIMCAC